MTDTPKEIQEEVPLELIEIISRFERSSITLEPRPPFVVSEHPTDTKNDLKDQKKKSNMAFRVGGRGGGRRRERPVANVEVLEAMQQMQARLEAMEMGRDADARDVSGLEVGAIEDEEPVDVTPKNRFSKSVLRSTSKARLVVSIYTGSLSPKELIDWINDMEKFSDYEETKEGQKVRFVVPKLKGHAKLWWDGVQAKRRRLGKQPIKNWNRMVEKLKIKFLPSDYQQTLFIQMKNLRQRSMTIKEYTWVHV